MTPESYHPRRIAVLIETSTSFGRGLLRGISRYARTHGGWELFFEPGGAEESFPLLQRWKPHGMLVRVHNRRLANRVLRTRLPAVDLGYVIPDLFPWSISNHQSEVGRLAGEHLKGCGFRNFAFCGWGPADRSARGWESQRLKAYREAVADVSDRVAVYRWPRGAEQWNWGKLQNHLSDWLNELPKPAGLFGSNDLRAQGILSAARLANLRVPEDLGLLGVDNDELLCEISTPTLSSVRLNLERLGYRGAELLDRLMRGDNCEGETIRIPPAGIVRRQSTETVATGDDLVVRAVNHIRQHLSEVVDVADLVGEMHVSRRALELRFHKALGRTPHAELTRLRMERARELLVHTAWPIKRIATECGFRYLENFHAVFRRSEGKTPGEFRKQRSVQPVP